MAEAIVYLFISIIYAICGAAIPFTVALAEAHLLKKSPTKALTFLVVAAICISIFVFIFGIDNKTSTGISPDWFFRRNSTYFLLAFSIQAVAAFAVLLGSSGKDIRRFWFRVSLNALLISVILLFLPTARAMLLFSTTHEDSVPAGIAEARGALSSLGLRFSFSMQTGLDRFLYGSLSENPAFANAPNAVMYYVSQENLRTSWGRSMERAGLEVKYVPEMIAVRGNEMIIISGFNKSSGSARFGVVEIWQDADPLFIKQVLKSISYRWYMEKPGYTSESIAPASRSSLQLGKADEQGQS